VTYYGKEKIRNKSKKLGEEKELKIKGHTVHFDGVYDQARDKAQTKFLNSEMIDHGLNYIEKDIGFPEIHEHLENIMEGKELFILFFCLGPVASEFSIPCVQLTDSAYVAHSEHLLYRKGYEEFKRHHEKEEFFKFVHSAGEVDKNKVSVNIDKRRI